MDLLDRVGQETRNKSSPDRVGLFQPRGGKAETVLLARLSAWLNRGASAGSRARSPIRLPRQLSRQSLRGANLIRDGQWRLMPFAQTNTIPITFDPAGMHRPGVGVPAETVGRICSC